MPITKSAKKALRVSKRRRVINLRVKRVYKEAVRDVRKPATAETRKTANAENTEKSAEALKKTATTEARKKKETRRKALTKAYSELDKAAKKGIIHKNKAARLKSRLAKLTQV